MYPTKLFFKIEEVKTFYSKQELNEFMITNPALQKIFLKTLHTGDKDKCNQENSTEVVCDFNTPLSFRQKSHQGNFRDK